MRMESNDYLEFENKFRGDRERIIDAFNIYEPLIELAIQHDPSANLVDIGCGRGEWLQKCRDKFDDCTGIESDLSMIKVCRDNGLNVIAGDAIDKLSEFASASVSIITIFHVIEHLEHENLIKLFNQCQRVLSDDGLLIMETPSIDSLIVSTKSFYIDHTHVNPINPDAVCFYIEKAGFSNVKHFYINGGPLQEASPLKITRILNGVAQDLCIIATKRKRKFDIIFSDKTRWQSNLNIGITTLEAAIDHDLKLESLLHDYEKSKEECSQYYEKSKEQCSQFNQEIYALNQEVSLLKEEISLFKARLKYIIYFSNALKILVRPVVILLRIIRRLILMLCNKIFKILVNYQFIRDILTRKKVLFIINFMLKCLMSNPTTINAIQIQNKVKKIVDLDEKSNNFNQNLLLHHKQSPKSRQYKQDLQSKKK